MQDQSYIPSLIVFGCTIMLLMALSIVLFVIRHQRKMHLNEKRIQAIENEKQIALFKASIEAEERQKEIIANNLHDSIKPMLSYLKHSLTKHQSDFLNDTFVYTNLDKDKKTIDDITSDITATCHDLIPTNLNLFGLEIALEDLIKALNHSKVIGASFKSDQVKSDLSAIPKMDQVNIYRVCQELINNILKHSTCQAMSMHLFTEQNRLAIELAYDGTGITNAEIDQLSKKGLGLNSLKSRVLILNANLNYLKSVNGYEIKFHIPLAA